MGIKRGIYCLETTWAEPPAATSIRPMLEWMRDRHGAPFVHRAAVTRNEFFHGLNKWKEINGKTPKGQPAFPILFLAYHGNSEWIFLRDDIELDEDDDERGYDPVFNEEIPIQEIAINISEVAEELSGLPDGRIVHFGSCSTVDVDNDSIESFLEETGALCVSGYREDVDWVQSMAFEVLYMEQVQLAAHTHLNKGNMQTVNKILRDYSPYAELRQHLGFSMRFST